MLNKKQYETPENFNARLYLTGKFKTNPESLYQWIFRHLPVKENLKVLELGCGTGNFWLSNKLSILKSWEILLTDYSQGMIDCAKQNLKNIETYFNFETVNAEDIKFEDKSFDVIIANLMLYHIIDKNKALNAISRVLKNNGIFIAATYGQNDMFELNNILFEYLESINKTRPVRKNSFSLENGLDQLKPFFSKIKLLKYENSLEITEAELIINYFFSLNNIKDGFIFLEKKDIRGFRKISK